MNEVNELRSNILGVSHSIKLLERERSKLEKKLSALTSDEKQIYLDKYDTNYRKFTKGIPQSKKPNEAKGVINNNLTIEDIGRLGEESYFNYLNEILDKDFCEVTWMNQEEESNKSFDFLVKIGRATFYVDVKTTRGRVKTKLYISSPEVRFAKSRKPNYFVARLSYWDEMRRFRAGDFNVTMLNLDEALTLSKIK